MKSPVSILLSGAGLAMVRLAAGLARSKWVASMFGLPGVGLLAQATQFQLVAASAASFSTSAAIIQGAKGPFNDRVEHLFRCAIFLMIGGLGVMTLIFSLVGFRNMGHWMLGPGFGGWDFMLIFLTLPFALLSSCFLECAFFVRDRFDRYAAMSGIHSILQSLCFISLSWLFGFRGLLAAFPVSSLLLFLLFSSDLARLGELNLRWLIPRWDPQLAKFLTRHGLIMFMTGVGGGFLLLFTRAALIRRAGLDDNGVLQVPIALSAYGSAIITNFLWGRVHPSYSTGEAQSSFELSLCTMAAFVVALGTWVAAPVFVPLIYSRDFSAAVPLVSIQCLGDIFHYSFFALAVAMLAAGRITTYLFGWALYYAPYLLLLLAPAYLSPHTFVSLHLAGSALAFGCVTIRSLQKGPLRTSQTLRLLSLSLALGACGGLAMLMSPKYFLGQLGCGLLAGVAGLVAWRYLYGPAVNEHARSLLKRLTWFSARERE